MECYWNRNTETTLAKLREASAGVAVIPLASIESHGPHLPLGSDTHNVEHVLKMVVQQETVAILPTVQYSFVASARQLPGAIHIPSDMLMAMVETICDEIHRNGFDKIVLLHGHGGNPALHATFVKRMLEREKPYATYSIPVQPGIADEVAACIESEHTGHACEIETSTNMVVCPELVNLDAIGQKTFNPQPGPEVGHAISSAEWISRFPEMAVGEPQKATREKGEKIIKLIIDATVKHLRLIKRDEITLNAIQQYARRANSIRRENSSVGWAVPMRCSLRTA